jgi:uncharacterized protein YjbI with pentapeptide repeats
VLAAAFAATGAWAAQRPWASAATTIAGCTVVDHPSRKDFTKCEGKIRNASFAHLDLRYAQFINADLSGANFNGANLTESAFLNARLDDAHFVGANLTIATLIVRSAVKTDFAGAILSGATIGRAGTSGPARFDDAIFRDANMVAVQDAKYLVWNGADMTNAILAYSEIKPDDLNGSAILHHTVCPNRVYSVNGRCP